MDLNNTKFLTGKLNLNTLENYGILNVPAEYNIPTKGAKRLAAICNA